MYSVVDVPEGYVGWHIPSVPIHIGGEEDFEWGAISSYQWNAAQALYLPSTSELVQNVGCLANHHHLADRVNLAETEGNPGVMYDRRDSPAAGAQTERTDWSYYVKNEIRAGDEIFISYGDDWFQDRGISLDDAKDVDMKFLEKVIVSLQKLARELEGESPPAVMNRFLSVVKSDILFEYEESFLRGIPEELDSLMNVTIPIPKPAKVEHSHTIEWIKANGVCLDNMVVKDSTLPLAGRGVFATRSLKKGELISRSPLLHAPRDNIELTNDTFRDERRKSIEADLMRYNYSDMAASSIDDLSSQRMLILNYMIGNPEAKDALLGIPTTAAAYMNHHSDNLKRNVEVMWTEDEQTSANLLRPISWFQESDQSYFALISVDFVATRDIQRGEEMFVNYGREWEAAWQAHLEHWTPHDHPKGYRDPLYYNKIQPDTGELPPIVNPSPMDYFYCKFNFTDRAPTHHLCVIDEVIMGETRDKPLFKTCFEHKGTTDQVTGRIKCKHSRFTIHRRDEIIIVDQPFTSNQWLTNSFRHEIGYESLRARWPREQADDASTSTSTTETDPAGDGSELGGEL